MSSIILSSNYSRIWNLEPLPFSLPNKLAEKIKSFALPLAQLNMNDSFFWKLTLNGEFSPSSAYNSLIEKQLMILTLFGSRKQTATNVKSSFFWKCFHKGLPISITLYHRNITPSLTYPLCNSDVERMNMP